MKIKGWLLLLCMSLLLNGAFAKDIKNNQPVVTITNIEDWNHPIKQVFKENNIILKKVELVKDKTYPKFYCKMPVSFDLNDYNKKNYYFKLFNSLSKANGFWSYQLLDKSNNLEISIYCDRSFKNIGKINVKRNGVIDEIVSWVIQSIEVVKSNSKYDEIKYLENEDLEKAIAIRADDILNFRLNSDYGEMNINMIRQHLVTYPSEYLKYCRVKIIGSFLTPEQNTCFGGFSISFSDKIPKGKFWLTIKEGMNQDEDYKVMTFKPIQLKLKME